MKQRDRVTAALDAVVAVLVGNLVWTAAAAWLPIGSFITAFAIVYLSIRLGPDLPGDEEEGA